MLVTVRHLGTSFSQEADYDTAVDIVLCSNDVITYVLELPSGVRLNVECSTFASTYSYLEPDFDELEATGILRYQQYPDTSKDPKVTAYYRMEVDHVGKLRPLTEVEALRHLDECGDEKQLEWEMAEAAQSHAIADPPLNPQSLVEALGGLRLAEGSKFEASTLGVEFTTWAEAADARGWELANNNLAVRAESRYLLAKLRLREQLG